MVSSEQGRWCWQICAVRWVPSSVQFCPRWTKWTSGFVIPSASCTKKLQYCLKALQVYRRA